MFVINVFRSSSETLSKLFPHLAVTYNKLFPIYLAVSHFLPGFALVFLSVPWPVALSSEHFQAADLLHLTVKDSLPYFLPLFDIQ